MKIKSIIVCAFLAFALLFSGCEYVEIVSQDSEASSKDKSEVSLLSEVLESSETESESKVIESEANSEESINQDESENSETENKITYKDMIDSLVSDALNTFEMTVGEEHKPGASLWLQNGGTAYSSDENVVTISNLGKVTAVGEGSAYIIITFGNTLFQVYRYDVYLPASDADISNLPEVPGVDFAKEIENFDSTALNTYSLKIGNTHKPTASVWASAGGTCYTSDDSVVTIASNGTVTAVGKGTAYVIIKSGVGNMFQIYKYIVNG